MAGVLFEDIFNVKDIDPEGKKFDRGESTSEFTFRRIRALSYRGDAISIALFPLSNRQRLVSRCSSTLPIAPARASTWCDS
ncbi:hypothetical protein P5V15_004229 [Pogonomyrmex californicus]